MQKQTLALATAAAALFSMTAQAENKMSTPEKGSTTVKCAGINSCKGISACKTAKSTCKGHNSCKGQGWLEVPSEQACKDKKGTVVKD